MIEVRTFEGDAAEAADFTRRTWIGRYELKVPVIDWSPEYFTWQLFSGPRENRDLLVAAYEGTQLVGTLFAEPMPFHLRGQPIHASMGSWLTVDPDHRGKGIANKLAEAQRARHRARDAKFMLGYGVLGTDGPKFWVPRADTQVLGTTGFWARMLDARRVAQWAPSRAERVLAFVSGPLLSGAPPLVDSDDIRRFEPGDLDACLELAQALSDQSELGYRWTRERLLHQLAAPVFPRTWVLVRDGRVRGFVNHYVIGMKGRIDMPVAVIDVLALGALELVDQKRLFARAVADMASQGAGLAIAIRIPTPYSSMLWRAGFVPMPDDTNYLCTISDPELPLAGVRKLHVTWR
jgi:GNAT superfamily N-acetyltransferase